MSNNKKETKKTKSESVETPVTSKRTINKPMLRDMVYENLNRRFTREAVYWIVNEVFHCLEDVLKEGNTVSIRDSFTLKPIIRKGKHFNTLGKYEGHTEDHYVPYFHPHKKLRDICLAMPVNEEVNNEEDAEDEE